MFKRLVTRLWVAVIMSVVADVSIGANDQVLARYGIGHSPSKEFINNWDIAIGPDGAELPDGRGTVAEGAIVYGERCAACHGPSGREGPDPILVGGQGTLASAKPLFTVGSYWAYATTLYDYIYRAMPFVTPGSLTPNEVYALCAYLLNANGIIADDALMDRESLPAVHMPNRDGFIPDPRPDVGASGQ